jgi:hypothetical protein
VLCCIGMSTVAELAEKFRSVWPLLDERTRRLMAANEAIALGYGGVSLVHRASGLSRKAIMAFIALTLIGIDPPLLNKIDPSDICSLFLTLL